MFTFFLAAALGDIRNENDPNCTYEGENTVILQQASMWLLGVRSRKLFGMASPLESASFLENCQEILKTKYNWTTAHEAIKPESIFDYFIKNCIRINLIYFSRYSFVVKLAMCMAPGTNR